MKKTMSLLGLFLAGIALLMNPKTGVLAAATSDTELATEASVTTTTVSGDPPADGDDEAIAVDTETDTAVVAETDSASSDDSSSSETYSVVGSEEHSKYGVFQVEVYVEDGEIVAIETLQAPSDHHSQSINSRAIASYEAAIIAVQSTDIDALSGATITWENYTASVQAALDTAGFSS